MLRPRRESRSGIAIGMCHLAHGAIDLLRASVDLERVPFGELVFGQKGIERLHASILRR
jgi:hypothetical protein